MLFSFCPIIVINKDKNGQSNLMHDDTFGPYHDTLGFTTPKNIC